MANTNRCSKCEKTNGHLAICPNAGTKTTVVSDATGKWMKAFICIAPGHLEPGDAVNVRRSNGEEQTQVVAYVVKRGEAGERSQLFSAGTPWTQFIPVPTEKPEKGERKSPTKVVQEQTGELLSVVMEMRKELAELKKARK